MASLALRSRMYSKTCVEGGSGWRAPSTMVMTRAVAAGVVGGRWVRTGFTIVCFSPSLCVVRRCDWVCVTGQVWVGAGDLQANVVLARPPEQPCGILIGEVDASMRLEIW